MASGKGPLMPAIAVLVRITTLSSPRRIDEPGIAVDAAPLQGAGRLRGPGQPGIAQYRRAQAETPARRIVALQPRGSGLP